MRRSLLVLAALLFLLALTRVLLPSAGFHRLTFGTTLGNFRFCLASTLEGTGPRGTFLIS